MSHSPLEPATEFPADATENEGVKDYAEGWLAINKLMRSGWSWSGNEANIAFLNLGPDSNGVPRFVDASRAVGFDQVVDGRAVVRMDVDFDGDLDLVLTSRDGPRLRVLRNELQTPRQFLALRLLDGPRNPTAIGARVELDLGDAGLGPRRIVRSVRAGEGFLSQQPAWVHLGLGDAFTTKGAALPAVHVRWADGTEELFGGLAAGGWFILERGAGQARGWQTPQVESSLRAGGVETPEPSSKARIVLPEPLAMPELALLEGDGQERRIFGIREGGQAKGTGRPLLIALWASWCTPCIAEFGELRDAAENLGTLGILALSVDQGKAMETAAEILERVRWPFPAAYASAETQAVIGVLVGALLDTEEPLSIPLGLLINARGELVCVYVGRVDPVRLLADMRLLDADPAERAFQATPFAGIWYRAPQAPAAASLEARLRARGLGRQANDYARAQLEIRQGDQGRVLYNLARRAAERGDLEAVVGLLQRALRADGSLVEAHADLGVALHRLGSFAKAVDAYSAALLLSNDASVRAKRGLSFVQLGRLDLAQAEVDYLRKAGAPEAEALDVQVRRARER